MKKCIALILAAVISLSLCACSDDETASINININPENFVMPAVEGTVSFEEFSAAEDESVLTVATYVQASQGCWYDSTSEEWITTLYTQNPEGAYFIDKMTVDEADLNTIIKPGTFIKVTGTKENWEGEVEITGATYEIIENADPYINSAADVTELAGSDTLENAMNLFVALNGLTIEAYNEDGDAFAYKNAGKESGDLYFKASVNGTTYSFCVLSCLRCEGSEVYMTVENLKVGDTVNVEGYLYWYRGAYMHVTGVTVLE